MSSNKRINKGNSLLCFPAEYVALDLETTGLSPEHDEIIEIAAVKISNGEIIDQYESLIRPSFPVDSFITDLTGITNEMLSDAPRIEDELHTFLDFVGNNIVVGHNVNFDINFIYDNSVSVLNKPFINDFVDTLRLSRRFYPEMPHHRLSDLEEKFNISDTEHHRALADCISSYRCFEAIHHDLLLRFENNDALSDALNSKKPVIDYKKIVPKTDSFDETNPLFGKICVFTGTLEKMSRVEAAQIVTDLGGICDNNVTKKTNYLILGNNDYCAAVKNGKSSKHIKAEKYKLNGIDIEIISENVFYDMLEFD